MFEKFSLVFTRGLNAIINGNIREFLWQAYELLYRVIKRIQNPNGVVLNIVEVIITTNCTLKCKNCSNLMQYYNQPQPIATNQICRDLDLLMQKLDYMGTIRLIGGEPFTVNNIHTIISHIKKYRRKYCLIKITTNGTITPKLETLKAMKDSNTYVKVSNYGKMSSNLDPLVTALKKHSILHEVLDVKWNYQRQFIDGITRNEKDIKDVYHKCKAECNSLLDGKLYHCPFLANGDKLRIFPHDHRNYINLKDPNVTKKDIKQYKSKNNVPPGCRYCSGTSGDLPSIAVAEQIKVPLPYYKYSENC